MAKEVKKGTKKAAAKPVAKKAVKKTPAKKTTRTVTATKKNNGIIPIVYMFLLILGVSLVFVSLTLMIAGYIETRLMATCLGVALVILILSAFIKKLAE